MSQNNEVKADSIVNAQNENVLSLPARTADPVGTLFAGAMYYNTTDLMAKVFNGTIFESLGGGGGSSVGGAGAIQRSNGSGGFLGDEDELAFDADGLYVNHDVSTQGYKFEAKLKIPQNVINFSGSGPNDFSIFASDILPVGYSITFTVAYNNNGQYTFSSGVGTPVVGESFTTDALATGNVISYIDNGGGSFTLILYLASGSISPGDTITTAGFTAVNDGFDGAVQDYVSWEDTELNTGLRNVSATGSIGVHNIDPRWSTQFGLTLGDEWEFHQDTVIRKVFDILSAATFTQALLRDMNEATSIDWANRVLIGAGGGNPLFWTDGVVTIGSSGTELIPADDGGNNFGRADKRWAAAHIQQLRNNAGDLALIAGGAINLLPHSGNTIPLRFFNNSSSFVGLQAPVGAFSSYDLDLPTTSGNPGQVLARGDSNNTTWIDALVGQKIPVRLATTAPLAGVTYTDSPNNGQFTGWTDTEIDAVEPENGDRILVQYESDAKQNGIYEFSNPQSSTIAGADDSEPTIDSDQYVPATEIQAQYTGDVTTVVNNMIHKGNSPDCDVTLEIWSSTAGAVGSREPDTLLGSSDVINAGSLPFGPASSFPFVFSTPVPVVAGTHYWLVMKVSNVVTLDASNNIQIRASDDSGDSNANDLTGNLSTDGGATWNNGFFPEWFTTVIYDAAVFTRALDLAANADVFGGVFVFAQAGDVNRGKGFVIAHDGEFEFNTNDVNWIPMSPEPEPLNELTFDFGDGSDGGVDLDGVNEYDFLVRDGSVYSLLRPLYLTDLTIQSGITLISRGFSIWAKGVLTNLGTIQSNGSNGPNGLGDGTGGAQASDSTLGAFGAVDLALNEPGSGGTTGNVNSGNTGGGVAATFTAFGVKGGDSGEGGAGTAGAGGLAGISASSEEGGSLLEIRRVTVGFPKIGSQDLRPGAGGSGGAAGAGDLINNGGGGGAGGNSGGFIVIFCDELNNAGMIQSNGGTGGNGGSPTLGNCGGGGAGGGGSGGTIYIISRTTTAAGTIQALGGGGGTGGSPSGTGVNGGGSSGGTNGVVRRYETANKNWI